MRVAFEFIATLSATLFCVAAVYINLVEHPARLACGTGIATKVWRPSYKRATAMQAPLAILGFLCGVVVWFLGGGSWWLIGALFIGAVVPFTFLAIMPTNHRLEEPHRDRQSDETRALLEKWGRLHAVRSTLSVVASVIYVSLLVAA